MATIKDLVNQFDPADIQFQVLTQGSCDLTIRKGKGVKPTHLEVKFQTQPNFITGKEAIILWVDKEKYTEAINKLKTKG